MDGSRKKYVFIEDGETMVVYENENISYGHPSITVLRRGRFIINIPGGNVDIVYPLHSFRVNMKTGETKRIMPGDDLYFSHSPVLLVERKIFDELDQNQDYNWWSRGII